MTRDEVLALNKIESATYVKPKSWARYGERTIDFYAFADGSMWIDCEMTDYSTLWFSVTKWEDVQTTAQIISILIDTTKEPNDVWYTSPLYKVLAACHVQYDAKDYGYCERVKICASKFVDFDKKEHEYTDNTPAQIANELYRRLLLAQSKAEAQNNGININKLKDIKNVLMDLQYKTAPNEVHDARRKSESYKQELENNRCLKLSQNTELHDLIVDCERFKTKIYNHYMDVVR